MASKDWITGQARDDTVFGRGIVYFGVWVVVPKRLDHGSQAVMTQYLVGGGCFGVWVVVYKRLDPGSSHPTKPLRALARTPTARDDTLVVWSGSFPDWRGIMP